MPGRRPSRTTCTASRPVNRSSLAQSVWPHGWRGRGGTQGSGIAGRTGRDHRGQPRGADDAMRPGRAGGGGDAGGQHRPCHISGRTVGTADAAAVPAILKSLEPFRPTSCLACTNSGHSRNRRTNDDSAVRVGLALLASEPDAVKEELFAWMLDTDDPRGTGTGTGCPGSACGRFKGSSMG